LKRSRVPTPNSVGLRTADLQVPRVEKQPAGGGIDQQNEADAAALLRLVTNVSTQRFENAFGPIPNKMLQARGKSPAEL